MGYVYTGQRRSLKFTLNKTENGAQAVGYPRTYDGKLGDWSIDFDEITDTQLGRLSESEYNARLTAFLAYVATQNAGFTTADFINASTNTNLTICPPPVSTTTTTV